MSNKEPLVYVVDDDQGVCDAMKALIGAAGLQCEAFRSAEAFLGKFDPKNLCCLVLDVSMPGMDGLELQRLLNERGIAPPIIFITGFGDVEMAVQGMKLGASDFLEKPFRNDQLLERIERALDIEAARHGEHVVAGEACQRMDRLTPREHQVLEGIVAGQSNKEIARELQIGSRTVEIHRAHVMMKMEVRSVVGLVRVALAARRAANA